MQASEKLGCSLRSQSSIRRPSWHGCSWWTTSITGEHLFIVTNVLRDSLCAFYKYLAAKHPSSGEHEHGDSPGVIAPWYRMRRQRVRQRVGHGM